MRVFFLQHPGSIVGFCSNRPAGRQPHLRPASQLDSQEADQSPSQLASQRARQPDRQLGRRPVTQPDGQPAGPTPTSQPASQEGNLRPPFSQAYQVNWLASWHAVSTRGPDLIMRYGDESNWCDLVCFCGHHPAAKHLFSVLVKC